MLIIVISHGYNGDPFTCSIKADQFELNKNDVDDVCNWIFMNQKVERDLIDEILIIENDDVVKIYHDEQINQFDDND